jgi:hypothetical protein
MTYLPVMRAGATPRAFFAPAADLGATYDPLDGASYG